MINKIQNIYPLSPMQAGLLFQSLYAPNSDAYFVQSIFELEREVDVNALRSAWQAVSNHHPVLRTGIVWEKLEEPLQYVLEYVDIPFESYDWQNIEAERQQSLLKELAQADIEKNFDLSKAPLFRIILIKFNHDKHYMIWSHQDRKSTRLNSSHVSESRMPSSA